MGQSCLLKGWCAICCAHTFDYVLRLPCDLTKLLGDNFEWLYEKKPFIQANEYPIELQTKVIDMLKEIRERLKNLEQQQQQQQPYWLLAPVGNVKVKHTFFKNTFYYYLIRQDRLQYYIQTYMKSRSSYPIV